MDFLNNDEIVEFLIYIENINMNAVQERKK